MVCNPELAKRDGIQRGLDHRYLRLRAFHLPELGMESNRAGVFLCQRLRSAGGMGDRSSPGFATNGIDTGHTGDFGLSLARRNY